jgi:hypothetical protein
MPFLLHMDRNKQIWFSESMTTRTSKPLVHTSMNSDCNNVSSVAITNVCVCVLQSVVEVLFDHGADAMAFDA